MTQRLKDRPLVMVTVLFTLLLPLSACDGGEEPAQTRGDDSRAAPQSGETEPEQFATAEPGQSEVISTATSASAATSQPSITRETPPQRPEIAYRTVYSLVSNRHLLHTYDTGLFIDFGTPAALKYVRGRWRGSHWLEGEEDAGRRHAWTDGVRSLFFFQIEDEPQDLELVVRMRATNNQRMDIFVNGERARSTLSNIPTSFGELRIPISANLLVRGENHIRFHFARSERFEGRRSTAGAFDYVRLQPPGRDPFEAHQMGAFSVEEVGGQQALSMPSYGRLTNFIMVPSEGRLRLRVLAASESAASIPVSVSLHFDGAEGHVLFEGSVTNQAQSVDVDLTPYAGEVARLELAAHGEIAEEMVHWVDPVIVVPERAASVFNRDLAPRHVLIWVVDALRSDALNVYNPDTRVEAPNMLAFSEQCVVFERATVQGNTSLPASGTIFSGTYPPVHGIVVPSASLPRDVVSMGQPFDQAGMATALFSSNGYVSERRGVTRGIDEYRNLIHEPGRAGSQRLWPIVREWLGNRREAAWFAFVWTIDPHVPYDPPEDILSLYYPGQYRGRIRPRATGELLDGLSGRTLEGDDLAYLRALYDGEITFNDRWFGTALEDLSNLGLLEDTLIVITADHGEAFFEHGRAGHGTHVHETQVSVPLLFCHPRSLEARRVKTESELIDIFPTLLDIMALPIPASIQGESLLPLMLDPTPVMNRPAFSYHQDFMRSIRIGKWKYIISDTDTLYDLTGVWYEGENVIEQHPIVQRYMRDLMSFHLAFATTWRKADWGAVNNHTPTFAELLDSATW